MNMHANENDDVRAPHYRGLSDSAKRDEFKAQAMVLPALAALRSALQDAAIMSEVMEDELRDLLGSLDDSGITERHWDNKIAELSL